MRQYEYLIPEIAKAFMKSFYFQLHISVLRCLIMEPVQAAALSAINILYSLLLPSDPTHEQF
jgi:hypothetical protein